MTRPALLVKPAIQFPLLPAPPFDRVRGCPGFDHAAHLMALLATLEIGRLGGVHLSGLTLACFFEYLLFRSHPLTHSFRFQPLRAPGLGYAGEASLTHRSGEPLRIRQCTLDLRQLLQPGLQLYAADIFKKGPEAQKTG